MNVESLDFYVFLSGWRAINLHTNIAIFENDLLDRNDELVQHPDQPVSEDNPMIMIRSCPRWDGFHYMYSVKVIPEDADVGLFGHGTIWELIKEGVPMTADEEWDFYL